MLQGYVCPGMLVLLAADQGVKVIQESDTGGQEQEPDTLVLGRRQDIDINIDYD